MTVFARLVASASVILFPVPSMASGQWCTGTVESVYIDSTGGVTFQASYRNDYTRACNVHGTWGGISTETCMTWYSALLAARVQNQHVTVFYATTTSCAALPTYDNSLVPGYVMVRRPT